jgi:apolipoprotein N-acyltransferase
MKKIFHHPIVLTAIGLGAIMLNPYWYFFPLAWIGFGIICIPIFSRPRLLRDLSLGYIAGLGFWSSRIHSIVPAYGWEMFLKCVLLGAVPWAVFLALTSIVAKRSDSSSYAMRLLIPTLAWTVLVTIFRASPVDGFPAEYMFFQPLAFMQVASLPLGLTTFITLMMLSNVAFGLWMTTSHITPKRVFMGCIAIGIIIGAGGFLRLHRNPIEEGGTPVAIIQTNLPISYEWRVENGDKVLEKYREMAMEAAKESPEMIFFSQYSFSMFYSDKETIAFFSDLAKKTGAHIAIGTYTDRIKIEGQEGTKRYNIGYVFSPEAGLLGSYRATSNLPFRKIGAAFGETFETIQTPIGDIGIFLCYDDMVRKVARQWVQNGADHFVVLSNPSTFSSPIVHSTQLIQDQFRAIETGKDLIRSSTNGISGVVDKYGRWKTKSLYDEETILHIKI